MRILLFDCRNNHHRPAELVRHHFWIFLLLFLLTLTLNQANKLGRLGADGLQPHASSALAVATERASASGSAIDRRDDHYAHIPTGWRRTTNGWEHTASWTSDSVVTPSADYSSTVINQWLQTHRQREPQWFCAIMQAIRSTSPLAIALVQLAAVGLTVILTSPNTSLAELQSARQLRSDQ